MRYPALIERDGDAWMVSFRDIPEALTGAPTIEEARAMGVDALRTAMDFYFEDRRAVPAPSAAVAGEELIELPPSIAAKVLLLNELVAQDIAPSDLARRMGVTKQEVTRIMDLGHATKIDTIAAALLAAGRSLELGVSVAR